MYEILAKYGFLEIISSNKFSFFSQKLPKKMQLNDELVKLNYKKYSPYNDPYIYYIVLEKQILIWFSDQKASESYIQIPQNYLLYKQLLKLKKDAIYIFENSQGYELLIIKDGLLVDTYFVDTIESSLLEAAKQQYALDETVSFDPSETKKYEQNAYKFIGLKELVGFLVYKFDKKTVLNSLINSLWLPVVLVLMTLVLINSVQGKYLEKQNNELLSQLETIKSENQDLKQKVRDYNQNVKALSEYVETEYRDINPTYLLDRLYNVVEQFDNTYLKSLNISNSVLSLQISTKEESVKLLKKLNGLNFVKNVTFKGRVKGKKDYRKEVLPLVLFEIELKTLKEQNGLL